MSNIADLFQPIVSSRIGPPPVVMRAVVTQNVDYLSGGMPQTSEKLEHYVLISSLPRELQERVHTAIQALISGM